MVKTRKAKTPIKTKEAVLLTSFDVSKDFDAIKAGLINVNDLVELQLSAEESKLVDEVFAIVLKRFNSIDQEVNEKHKKYIKDILTILVKGKSSFIPDLIPLTMGAGKSLIIEEFIKMMVSIDADFGAIVVKERNVDLDDFVVKINKELNKEVAYALHGFDKSKCDAKKQVCVFHECHFRSTCRYYNQLSESKRYPIVAITHVRLEIDNVRDKLNDNYGSFCDEDGVIHERTRLLIDERPQLVYSQSMSNIEYDDIEFWIDLALESDEITEEERVFVSYELKKAHSLAIKYLTIPEKKVKRESLAPINENFNLGDDTKTILYRLLGYRSNFIKNPYFLESLIRYGGHREMTFTKSTEDNPKRQKQVIIHTSHYKKASYPSNFHTILFDGTADIDLTYRHENYRMFNFEPVRSYGNLNIYTCSLLKSSKSVLKQEAMLLAFCNDVKTIAKENPDKKIYLVAYLELEEIIEAQLIDYIKSGRIKLAHFGATKGSNDFLDCDITILGGIVHKSESYYIGLYNAVNDTVTTDLKCTVINKKRRFDNLEIEKLMTCDMLVDITQEIKRGSQRDNTRDVKGDVYLFSNNELLLELAGQKFPLSKNQRWSPTLMVDEAIKQKENHSQVVHLPILMECIREFSVLEEFTTADVMEKTGIPSQMLSLKLKDHLVAMKIAQYGFEKIRNPSDRRQFMYVKNL